MKQQALNPFLPSYEYVPDGEPHVFGDRVYLFGSHDRFGGKKFCMNDYVCWSAPVQDLGNWRHEGIIYRKTQDPNNTSGKLQLYAPDVAQGPDGRYYLYYCLGEFPQIGVAVCDTPCGKYAFLGYVQDKNGGILGRREGDSFTFDPAVLVDEDGSVYLYNGNGPLKLKDDKKRTKASTVAKLMPDMRTLQSEPQKLIPTLHDSSGTDFEGHEFFEASSIRRFEGRYYFIYSSVQLHELCYAVSDRPDKGFRYGGVLVSNGDTTPGELVKLEFNGGPSASLRNYVGNNHGSLVLINDAYYIFYHRQTNRHMYSRQACAERIEMQADGHFRQAQLTSCGLNNAPLAGKGEYEARIACNLMSREGAVPSVHPMVQNRKHPAFTQEGKDREDTPGQYVENMRDGAVAGFRYFAFENAREIGVLVRGKGQGEIVVTDAPGGNVLAQIPLALSGEWKWNHAPLCVPDGVHALYFTYSGKGAMDFFRFALA